MCPWGDQDAGTADDMEVEVDQTQQLEHLEKQIEAIQSELQPLLEKLETAKNYYANWSDAYTAQPKKTFLDDLHLPGSFKLRQKFYCAHGNWSKDPVLHKDLKRPLKGFGKKGLRIKNCTGGQCPCGK